MTEYFNSEDLYEDSVRIEEQDLRLLKALVSDQDVARNFESSFDDKLFIGDAKPFARDLLRYYRQYGTVPTRRVMVEEQPTSADITNYIWDELDKIPYEKSEFQYDLSKVKDRYSLNKVLSMKNAIDEMGFGQTNYDKVLRDLRADLEAAEKIRRDREDVYTQKTLAEYMPEFRSDWIKKQNDPSLGRGILTRYSYLDYVLNGLSPSDMLIVAAETGGGKSIFLNNLAIQMWMQGNTTQTPKEEHQPGYNIQYFSLEMPYDQCARRALARIGDVPTYALRDCSIANKSALHRLGCATQFIKEFENSFEIVDISRGVTVDQIEERYLEAVARGRRPDVVVVDYIGLMEDNDTASDDWLKLGHIAGKLHEFCRTYGCVLATAVQLNRPKGKKDPNDIIGLHRIGRSSLIMHHATVGVQIETRPNEESFDDMVYHIIKNRNGERGQHILKKNFACASLVDLDVYTPPAHSDVGFGIVNATTEDLSAILDSYGWYA